MISRIGIANFKSIKNLDLDCKRINIFIGKPNVGKSNILESLSFSNISRKGNISDIRFESIRNLFYDQDLAYPILIILNDIINHIKYYSLDNAFKSTVLKSEFDYSIDEIKQGIKNANAKKMLYGDLEELSISTRDKGYVTFDDYGKLTNSSGEHHRENHITIKKYIFKKANVANMNKEFYEESLNDPYGENLFELLKNNRKLLSEVGELFEEYGYSLVIDFISNKAEIQKIIGNVSYKIPYALVADTLQRMVFYLVAIRTNKDCVILLEEPENHSFPPYIRDIAFEIINATSNQFFIATHSPYLVNTLMAEANKEDLAINIVSYSDFETKVKTLSNDEIAELSNSGVDLFFNIDMFAQ